MALHHTRELTRSALVEAVQEFLDRLWTWIWNWLGLVVVMVVVVVVLALIMSTRMGASVSLTATRLASAIVPTRT